MLTGKWTPMNQDVRRFNSLVNETMVMSEGNNDDWMTKVEILYKSVTGLQHCILHQKSRQRHLTSAASDYNRMRKPAVVSGEIPSVTDNLSVRSTSGPLGPGDKHVDSLLYIDPRQPVPVRIVDPSKDLNSYGLGDVDWKERVKRVEAKVGYKYDG
ncbi:hypothetical protein Tco_0140386 [Tanacetum coccineum]